MNQTDNYSNIAETYDEMLFNNPARGNFFAEVFQQYQVSSVLDCACGTGKDLILFHSLGCDVTGSDFSEAMLKVAQKRMDANGLEVLLYKVDYQYLETKFTNKFDAIV